MQCWMFILIETTPAPPPCNVTTPLELGDLCGSSTARIGYCRTVNSACVQFNTTDERRCQCVRNFVRSSSTCVEAPTALTTKQSYDFTITENHFGLVGVIKAKVYNKITLTSYKVTTYPSNSILRASINNGSSVELTLSKSPVAAGEYNMILELSAQVDYLNITNIVTITVMVKYSSKVQDIVFFLSDGTLKYSTIDNIGTKFQDMTYQLSTTDPNFGITGDGTIYSTTDIYVDSIAGSNFIAVEIHFNVTASKGATQIDLVHYKILIVKNRMKILLEENTMSTITQLHLLSDNFLFSSDDLPSKFNLSDNGISVSEQDYEKENEFHFSVIIKTKDNINKTTVNITVMVNDENDESPVFDKDQFHFHTLSNTLSKTVIGVVTASDTDTVGSLHYKIKDFSYITQFIEIKETSGTLKSLQTLTSHQFGSSITFNVTVCDDPSISKQRCDQAIVVISLMPISLHTENLNLKFNGTVEENKPKGTYVTSVHVHDYTGYRSIDMTASGLYLLDDVTGNITTLKKLDRENVFEEINEYFIQAHKVGKDQCFLDDVGTVKITVTDKNDNQPTFKEEWYLGTIYENSPKYSTVYFEPIIHVTDLDSGTITFSVSGNGSDKFSVSTTNDRFGVVKTAGELDRETHPHYILILTATDGRDSDGTQYSATTMLNITILDVNDNPPVFVNSSYSITITEEVVPKVILTVHANDPDSGINSKVMYHIVHGSNGYFSIDEKNGTVKTIQKIDREEYEEFHIQVVASDSGNPRLSVKTTITVFIKDINDNDPVLSNVENVHYLENMNCSIPITTVSAMDPDYGQNAKVVFSTTNNRFNISQTGILYCVLPLDYEVQKYHNVTIIATDNGHPSRSTNKTMIVSVKDVNDNVPQFMSHDYTTNITSGDLRANKPVIVIHANDVDTGRSGEITFSLSNSIFNITSVNNVGIVKVKTDVTNADSMYRMNVTATDKGDPPLTNQTTITIFVTDSGSSTNVKFKANDFNFIMEEGKEYTNESIGMVEVANHSSPITVEFSLPENFASYFYINNASGEIFCSQPLDREKSDSHQIVVRVYSTKDKKDGDIALITISVTDINDNVPEFKNNNTLLFKVPENKADFTVCTLTAIDRDKGENGTITYKIKELKKHLPFQINETTGVIHVSAADGLDYEDTNQYHVTIEAVDQGRPPLSASVIITVDVMDENDHPPVFEELEYSTHVSEAAHIGQLVLYLNATDNDTGHNAELYYTIGKMIQGKQCNFSIVTEDITGRKVGRLQVNGELDYETTKSCELEVVVYDHQNITVRLNATTTVKIFLDDVNDNSPVFVGEPYNTRIARDLKLRHVVFNDSTIQATDRDSGQNGQITFSFTGENTDYFQISPSSGEITVIKSLRKAPNFISLSLTATDKGAIPHSTTTKVTIYITDTNIRPWFKTNYTFSVVEEASPDNFKNRVEAFDKTIHGREISCDCVYELSPLQEHGDLFSINNSTGEMRQVKVIDREKIGDVIFITVKATDKGDPPKSTETEVQIKIKDINDHMSHFTDYQQNQYFDVGQNVNSGLCIGNIAYTDEDSPINSNATMNVMFVLPQTEQNLFRLDTFGNIYVNESLARNSTDDYEVQLLVRVKSTVDTYVQTSSTENSLIDVATVNMNIIYYTNNTAPRFTKDLYVYQLPFFSRKKTIFDLDIKAVDDQADAITYKLMGDNPREVFLMDPITAKIELQYDVDDTIPISIKFRVSAVDDNVVPKTSYTMVDISVIGKEETECLLKSRTDALRNDSEIKTTITILFAVMSSLMSIVLVVLVITCYKWRVSERLAKKNTALTMNQSFSSRLPTKYETLTSPTLQTMRASNPYEKPEDARYTSFVNKEFSVPSGTKNPAYSSLNTLRFSLLDEPPVDYDDCDVQEDHISLDFQEQHSNLSTFGQHSGPL